MLHYRRDLPRVGAEPLQTEFGHLVAVGLRGGPGPNPQERLAHRAAHELLGSRCARCLTNARAKAFLQIAPRKLNAPDLPHASDEAAPDWISLRFAEEQPKPDAEAEWMARDALERRLDGLDELTRRPLRCGREKLVDALEVVLRRQVADQRRRGNGA